MSFHQNSTQINDGLITLKFAFVIILISGCKPLLADSVTLPRPSETAFFSRLSFEEKVGQLIWLKVGENLESDLKEIKRIKPAGVMIRNLNSTDIIRWTTAINNLKLPIPVLIDGNLNSIPDIIQFPVQSSFMAKSGVEYVDAYESAVNSQMEVLGFDREVGRNRDLNLDIQPVTGHEEALKSILLNSDGILVSGDISFWHDRIFRLIKSKEIPRKFFNERVNQMLSLKDSLRSNKKLMNAHQMLSSPKYEALAEQLFRDGFEVLNDPMGVLPIKLSTQLRINFYKNSDSDNLLNYLRKYAYVEVSDKLENLLLADKSVNGNGKLTILSLAQYPETDILSLIDNIHSQSSLVICYLGERKHADELAKNYTVIWHPESTEATNRIAGQIIFGGISTQNINRTRLSFSNPEYVGMDSDVLEQIDNILMDIPASKASPGGQVLIARKGEVVYQQSFGSLIYEDRFSVTDSTLYDLASITKVLATVTAIMKLDEDQRIDLSDPIGKYLEELKGTDKDSILIRDILTHTSGLFPYIPFWKRTINKEGLNTSIYHPSKDEIFDAFVSPGMYSTNALQDTLWKWTIKSQMRRMSDDKEVYDYRYSDIGFFILKELVERVTGDELSQYLEEQFYLPLGLRYLGFRPLDTNELSQIAPTEYDRQFRSALVHGTPHDRMAAMFGGVAGHAGLFSNAFDAAQMMQMFLWNGSYAGSDFLDKKTIDKYTSRQSLEYRRGLGWDRPDEPGQGNASQYASSSSYGHTGFTGTMVWADPEFDLVYVFLSNRVHPSAENNGLSKGDFRIRIQDLIYKSIFEYEKQQSL